MRIAAVAGIVCLASCTAALSQSAPASPADACAGSEADPDSLCAWRTVNANRAPGAFEGYYRAVSPRVDAELAVVDDGEQVFVAANYWIGSQTCTARFEARRDGEGLVLTPAPELAIPGAVCSATLHRGASGDEVVFAMQQSCSSACRVPLSAEPVQFRIADPLHD